MRRGNRTGSVTPKCPPRGTGGAEAPTTLVRSGDHLHNTPDPHTGAKAGLLHTLLSPPLVPLGRVPSGAITPSDGGSDPDFRQ